MREWLTSCGDGGVALWSVPRGPHICGLRVCRVYFYHSLAHEQSGSLDQIRSTLLGLHRTAVLRHDALGQETLMCLLLRNYLAYNLYDQVRFVRWPPRRPQMANTLAACTPPSGRGTRVSHVHACMGSGAAERL